MKKKVYKCDELVDMRITSSGHKEFFVKWTGYPHSENTWEKEIDIL